MGVGALQDIDWLETRFFGLLWESYVNDEEGLVSALAKEQNKARMIFHNMRNRIKTISPEQK